MANGEHTAENENKETGISNNNIIKQKTLHVHAVDEFTTQKIAQHTNRKRKKNKQTNWKPKERKH